MVSLCRTSSFSLPTIDDFLQIGQVQKLIIELDDLKLQSVLLDFINSNIEFLDDIKTFLSANIGDSIHGLPVYNYYISDSGECVGVIVMYGLDPEIDVDFRECNYYGSGIFGATFKVRINVTVEMDGYRNDYYSEYGDEDFYPSNDHNGHFFYAEEDHNVEVLGNLTFKLESHSTEIGNNLPRLVSKSLKIEKIEKIIVV